MRTRIYGILVITLLLIPLAIAQNGSGVIEPTGDATVNPDANISFPPPVYVVRDSVDIRGTANLPNLTSFLVEFRPLDLDDTGDDAEEERPWFPATVTQFEPVLNDILGPWNTRTARDGLYELRMTINTTDGQEYVRVSPIRVENNPPPFVDVIVAEAEERVEEAEPVEEPEPTAEPVEDTSPRAVALVNSNVRSGDSTDYGIVGFLLEGETADIRGVSSRGTRWFFIQLANGVSGFIHPNIVRTEGFLSGLSLINPPPLPPTPIPIPTTIPAPPVAAPPVPATGADLVFAGVQVVPHPPRCREAYQINVTVRNAGNGDAHSGGIIEVRDSLQSDGRLLGTTQIAFGPLAAGAQQSVFGHLTMNLHFNETHNVNLYLDVNSQVAETNENNNHHADAPYILQRAGC